MAEHSPATVPANSLRVVVVTPEQTVLDVPSDFVFDRVYRSQDAQEGPRAFREKRKPVWKNC